MLAPNRCCHDLTVWLPGYYTTWHWCRSSQAWMGWRFWMCLWSTIQHRHSFFDKETFRCFITTEACVDSFHVAVAQFKLQSGIHHDINIIYVQKSPSISAIVVLHIVGALCIKDLISLALQLLQERNNKGSSQLAKESTESNMEEKPDTSQTYYEDSQIVDKKRSKNCYYRLKRWLRRSSAIWMAVSLAVVMSGFNYDS